MRKLVLASALVMMASCGGGDGGKDGAGGAGGAMDGKGGGGGGGGGVGGGDAGADQAADTAADKGGDGAEAAGDTAGDSSGDAVTDGSGEGAPAPGKITAKIAGLSGAASKALVVFSGSLMGSPAGTCFGVSSDPFSAMDTLKPRKSGAMSPCEFDAGDKLFGPATYAVSFYLFAPPAMMPEKCATAMVKVDGDVTVTAPALGACP